MRILIPVDGSTYSRAAVRFIGARSKFMGEKPDVTLLNVQQNIPGTVIEHFSLEAVRSVYEAEGKAIVEKLAPEIEAYGIEPHMAVRIDDCGPAVAKIAVDDNIDLITMGSRGLSPVKSFFLGSVSSSWVRTAGASSNLQCSVQPPLKSVPQLNCRSSSSVQTKTNFSLDRQIFKLKGYATCAFLFPLMKVCTAAA